VPVHPPLACVRACMLVGLLTSHTPCLPLPLPATQTSVSSNGDWPALTVSNSDTGSNARSIKVTAGKTELGQTSVTSDADSVALTVVNREWSAVCVCLGAAEQARMGCKWAAGSVVVRLDLK